MSKEGYRPGLVVISERLLQMLRETGIVPGPCEYDLQTGELRVSLPGTEAIEKARKWYAEHPEDKENPAI